MVDLVGIGVVAAGAIVLVAGAALSVYGVAILGLIVGGATGYLFAPTIGGALGLEGIVAVLGATGLGVLVGIVAAYLLLSMAVAAISFVVGIYAGLVFVPPLLGDGAGLLVYPAAIAVGVVAAVLGSLMTRTAMIFVSSFVGTTLVTGSITASSVATAGEQLSLDPLLFDPTSLVFLGLFAFGLLTQFGLFKFGYVTKFVGMLPGASVLHDRGRGETASGGKG